MNEEKTVVLHGACKEAAFRNDAIVTVHFRILLLYGCDVEARRS
jgi:hypothetical protein